MMTYLGGRDETERRQMRECSVLDIKEFCREFRVGMTFAYNEIKAGRLRARKAGRRTIVLRRDAIAWADNLPLMSA